MKKVKLILIGAGDRGTSYVDLGAEFCPEMEIVAVADIDPTRRNYIQDKFGLSENMCFEHGENLLKLPKMADAVIIATQDKQHYHLALAAIEKGYHLLLEKPAAPTPEECLAIAEAANAKGVHVIVCHVLRFTPFFRLLKNTIDSGRIGKVMNMIHIECVGNVHQSHSYVRGNWHKAADSSPMILAKSCHDIDILQWLLDEECTRVQSFGSLTYFRKENMPEGAPEYCYQGCPAEKDCPYSALKIYQQRTFPPFVGTATKKHNPTDEDIWKAITETDYGKCVFRCDNDVVDHQIVNLEYASGATVSFTMSAFNKGGRKIRIMGTKGEITAEMRSDHITVFDFETRETEKIMIADAIQDEEISGGHGGGDRGIIRSFCQFLVGTYSGNSITDISTSIDNHLTAFAAEESRLLGTVVTMKDYKDRLNKLKK
ncbi:MAG: Gfo/Idh/MocA family oxidoreductase [Ruminococcaceae bacterium]|nr:Gfo/Idh/MocA family oxidoreductase [Oscillospiraceae bacterium]